LAPRSGTKLSRGKLPADCAETPTDRPSGAPLNSVKLPTFNDVRLHYQDRGYGDVQPNFGPAIVVVAPGTITGSSRVNIDGAAACVQGDEASVSVPVTYSNPGGGFGVLGAGTLTISALGADQLGQKTSSTQKPLILKGSTFTALLTVQAPASNPTAGPDPVPMYTGTGQFVTTNVKSKGT
jgi:Contractile injection system spike tip protein